MTNFIMGRDWHRSCVSLRCFADEVEDPMRTEYIFIIWSYNRIKGDVLRDSYSVAVLLFVSVRASLILYVAFVLLLFVPRLFFIWCLGNLCFVTEAFSWYLHIC